jgi:hypothetical protein
MIRFSSLVLFLLLCVPLGAQQGKSWVNGLTHEGVNISVDLPEKEHIRNIGSKLDGAGMCVFSSIEMSARYQGLEQMRGYRDWWASVSRGGGWPEQVDKSLNAWWKHKGITPIPYLQYEGKDPAPLLHLIDKTNRMASITYGYSPRYGSRIAHMTNAVLFHEKFGVVLDNNFPGEKAYEWMTKEELISRMRMQTNGQQGGAWVFVWLTPGSPPPPKVKR